MTTNAITAKDRIFDKLSLIPNKKEFITQANTILDALDLTDGLWQELGYSYKAVEICTRIYDMGSSYITRSANDPDMELQTKLHGVTDKAIRLGRKFYQLQQQRMDSSNASSMPQGNGSDSNHNSN
jgi:hypothetical protein